MTARDFFRRALAAPLVVPVLLAAVDFGLGYRGPGLQAIRIVEVGALVGTLPYLVACVPVLRWTDRHSEHAIATLALASPVVFAPVAVAFAVLVALVRGAGLPQLGGAAAGYALFTLIIGYGYVLAAFLVLGLLRLLRVVRPETGLELVGGGHFGVGWSRDHSGS